MHLTFDAKFLTYDRSETWDSGPCPHLITFCNHNSAPHVSQLLFTMASLRDAIVPVREREDSFRNGICACLWLLCWTKWLMLSSPRIVQKQKEALLLRRKVLDAIYAEARDQFSALKTKESDLNKRLGKHANDAALKIFSNDDITNRALGEAHMSLRGSVWQEELLDTCCAECYTGCGSCQWYSGVLTPKLCYGLTIKEI